MKKTALTILICLSSAIAFSQTKPDTAKAVKDTTIQVTMNINQFRQLLGVIDANIDSKRVSKELVEFLSKSAQIVQPADKQKKQ